MNDEENFIIELLGIIGLMKINLNNNIILKNRIKQNIITLKSNNPNSLNLIRLLDKLYKDKKITFSVSTEIINLLNSFREEKINWDSFIKKIQSTLKGINDNILNKLKAPVQSSFESFLNNINTIEDVVPKLLNYCKQKNIKNDFVDYSSKMVIFKK